MWAGRDLGWGLVLSLIPTAGRTLAVHGVQALMFHLPEGIAIPCRYRRNAFQSYGSDGDLLVGMG